MHRCSTFRTFIYVWCHARLFPRWDANFPAVDPFSFNFNIP